MIGCALYKTDLLKDAHPRVEDVPLALLRMFFLLFLVASFLLFGFYSFRVFVLA